MENKFIFFLPNILTKFLQVEETPFIKNSSRHLKQKLENFTIKKIQKHEKIFYQT
jgi:hypothetical protein